MQVKRLRMKPVFTRYSFFAHVLVICSICVIDGFGKPANRQNEFGTYLKNGQVITGFVGCLFSKTLCEPRSEWCYNDGAFGRCLSSTGVLDNESLYRYDLSKSDTHAVEKEMERLFAMGNRWGHLYTQCVLQTLLESIRRGFNWDQSICAEVQDQDLEGALKAFEEDVDPKNLAYIKYHPSSSNFAEESYRPPKELTHLKNAPIIEGKQKLFDSQEEDERARASDQLKKQTIDLQAGKIPPAPEQLMDQKAMEAELANAVEKTKSNSSPKGKNKNKNKNKGNTGGNKGDRDRKPQIVKKSVLNMEYPYPYDLISPQEQPVREQEPKVAYRENDRGAARTPDLSPKEEEALLTGLLREWNSLPIDEDVELPSVLKPKIFSSFYNTPDLFRLGVESRDEAPASAPLLGYGSSAVSGYDDARSLVDEEMERQRALAFDKAELNRREEEQEIRDAAAQLEAALLAESLQRKENEALMMQKEQEQQQQEEEEMMGTSYAQVKEQEGEEPLEYLLPGHYKLPVVSAQDPISHLAAIISRPATSSIFTGPIISSNGGDLDDFQRDDPIVPEELSFINQNKINNNYYGDLNKGEGQKELPTLGHLEDLSFYDLPLTKEDEESLMYLKRFIGKSPGGPDEEREELLRSEREGGPEESFDRSDFLLYDTPENVEEEFSFLGDTGYGGGNMGFARQERLDVKKPGPWYRTVNNYAFDKKDEDLNEVSPVELNSNPEFGGGEGPADMIQYGPNSDDLKDTSGMQSDEPTKPGQGAQISGEGIDMNKKSVPVAFGAKWGSHPSNIDYIDTSYVDLELDKNLEGFNGAKELLDLLADLLGIEHSAFQDILINNDNKNVISFKVVRNGRGLNATTVAQEIENVKDKIAKELEVNIVKINVGLKTDTKTPSVVSKYVDDDITSNRMFLATFAVCGLVAAVLVAAVALFLVRKHAKSKEKLVRLSQDDPSYEACKDYQDLCRARMAGSKNNEKMEPLRGPAHKVASKDSENGSSSSRSSTSSWSEEPVLTNMDISTGHMVLSYMEDHLKNRDRMDREWAALTAYEADPCSTAVAEKAENAKKNRYSNSLPFDHSRVILNDLANVTGTDYINASTITDHDPRNPAYISTQGPLPNTVADFWQMVWEQGSVVIVNLTRLAENGTALCHRYWPEEGSELHHIYEVHLVSEHIWCDEYLVRSFYLKNLKTGETRTVTQFHFLAWPETGIPQSTKALLEFRRKVNKSYRGRSCPIIVHCSDGAGRTGTYCLIDMVLNRMSKGAKEIDIAATLEHIRDQRPNMVRSKQQFEFVLMAVAEEVHAILKALPQ